MDYSANMTIVKAVEIVDAIDTKRPSGALFDSGRRYRYILWRSWDEALPAVSFIMLNPSAADEEFNDPTISRSILMARDLGFGRLFVVNLFAYMTKSPALLKAAAYPISPRASLKQGLHNDDYINFALTISQRCVMAWGNHGVHFMAATFRCWR